MKFYVSALVGVIIEVILLNSWCSNKARLHVRKGVAKRNIASAKAVNTRRRCPYIPARILNFILDDSGC